MKRTALYRELRRLELETFGLSGDVRRETLTSEYMRMRDLLSESDAKVADSHFERNYYSLQA